MGSRDLYNLSQRFLDRSELIEGGLVLTRESTTLFPNNLPAEGVETSRKILIIRVLSKLQKSV